MKDFLEYFPLKRYGAIASLFVFVIFSLYYLFVFSPSIDTNRRYSLNCKNPWISLNLSVPQYITNHSTIKIDIQNNSPTILNNLKILSSADVKLSQMSSRLFIDDVNVDLLDGNIVTSKTTQVSAYYIQDGSPVSISFYADYQGDLSECSNGSEVVTTYHSRYASAISAFENYSLVLSIIFFISIVGCSITQDDNQDFHPLSQLGKYHIVRIVMRVSLLLTILFVVLQVVTNTILGIGVPSYDFKTINPYNTLPILFFVPLLAIPIITRLISIKPKAKIVINPQGTEKEIEILSKEAQFNFKSFLDKIVKKKKH